MDFVGELYRRKMLPETVLKSVFTSLLGMSELNNKVSDLNVEGATRLMNKVGETFEQRSSSKKKAAGESESFVQIMNKFEEIMNLPDDSDQISKRMKLLIKNMFTNKESGWAKTKDLNEGGPKTKAEVQSEVTEKYEKERQAQEDDRNKYYNRDNRDNRDRGGQGRGYNDRDRDNRDNRDNRGGNKQNMQYMQKGKSDMQKGKRDGDGDFKKTKSYNEKGGNTRKSEAKRDVVPMTDDELSKEVKKILKNYINFHEQPQEEEPEEGEEKPKKKEFDYNVFKKLKDNCGQKPSNILFFLYSNGALDEGEEDFLKYMPKMLNHFAKTKALF